MEERKAAWSEKTSAAAQDTNRLIHWMELAGEADKTHYQVRRARGSAQAEIKR